MQQPRPGIWVPIAYTESDSTQFAETSWDELAKLVAAYRKRKGVPEGNVLADIFAQVCANYPYACREVHSNGKPAKVPPKSHVKNTVHSRILRWIGGILRAWKRGEIALVSENVVADRAKVCRNCPRQIAWTGACHTCTNTIDEAAKSILGKRFKKTKDLKGCSALGEDTRLSVWLDLSRADISGLPPACWRI